MQLFLNNKTNIKSKIKEIHENHNNSSNNNGSNISNSTYFISHWSKTNQNKTVETKEKSERKKVIFPFSESKNFLEKENEKVQKINDEQISNIRYLKRKITKIVKSNSRNVCSHFESQNQLFNDKFMSYLQGPVFLNRMKKYQKYFHYHMTNEVEDKIKKVLDFDKIKYGILSPAEILKRSCSQEEIDIIGKEPTYFIQHLSKDIQGVKLIKTRKLIERLEDEDKMKTTKVKKSCSMDDILIKTKVQSLGEQKVNFTKKIDDAVNTMNGKLHKIATKSLKNKEFIPSNDFNHLLEEHLRKIIVKKYEDKIRLGYETKIKYSQNIRKEDMRAGLIEKNRNRLQNESFLGNNIPFNSFKTKQENDFTKDVLKKIRMAFFAKSSQKKNIKKNTVKSKSMDELPSIEALY